MDFNSLSRKELQDLCKKHGIPANLKSVVMASRLSSLLSSEEKPEKAEKRGRSCLKDLSVVNVNVEDERVVEGKEVKKVKFSPENQTFVYEKTDPRAMRLLARKRRSFVNVRKEEPLVIVAENVENSSVVSQDGRVDEPVDRRNVRRNLRRKNMAKPDGVGSVSEMVDDVVELPVEGAEQVRNLRSRRGKMIQKGEEEMSSLSPPAIVAVDKAVGEGGLKRNSRRKSVLRSDDVVLVSEKVDTVDELPVDGAKVSRNLRSRRGKVKQNSAEDSSLPSPCAVNDVGKVVDEGGLKRNPRSRKGKANAKEKTENVGVMSPCDEKMAKRTVKSRSVVKGGVDGGVDRPPDKIVDHGGNEGRVTRRQLSSKQVVYQDSKKDDACEASVVNDRNLEKRGGPRKSKRPVEVRGKDDAAVNENQEAATGKHAEMAGVVDGNNLGKRGRTRKSMVLYDTVPARANASVSKEQEKAEEKLAVFSSQMAADNKRRKRGRKNTLIVGHQVVKRGMEQVLDDIGEGIDGDCQVLNHKDSRTEDLQSKSKDVETDDGAEGLQGLRGSSRQAAKSEVDAALNEQAVDGNDHQRTAHLVNQGVDVSLFSMEKPDIVPGGSTPAGGLIECRKHDEQYHGIGDSTPRSQKPENIEEETLCFSNSSLQLQMVYESMLSKSENIKEATPSSSNSSLQLRMAYESMMSKLSKDTGGSKATCDVDASLCEQVVDENEFQSEDQQQEGSTSGLKHAEAVRDDHISAEDSLPGVSTEADSISESRKSDGDEQYATAVSAPGSQTPEDIKGETLLSSNSSQQFLGAYKRMLSDMNKKAESSTDKARESVEASLQTVLNYGSNLSLLQGYGNSEANKVHETPLGLSDVVDNSSQEENASSAPSIVKVLPISGGSTPSLPCNDYDGKGEALKVQETPLGPCTVADNSFHEGASAALDNKGIFGGSSFNSKAAQNSTDARGSTMPKTSPVSNAGDKQTCSSVRELARELVGKETIECKEGLESYQQQSNEKPCNDEDVLVKVCSLSKENVTEDGLSNKEDGPKRSMSSPSLSKEETSIRGEQSSEEETGIEKPSCVCNTQNSIGDKLLDFTAMLGGRVDAQPLDLEEVARSTETYDNILREAEQTDSEISLGPGSLEVVSDSLTAGNTFLQPQFDVDKVEESCEGPLLGNLVSSVNDSKVNNSAKIDKLTFEQPEQAINSAEHYSQHFVSEDELVKSDVSKCLQSEMASIATDGNVFSVDRGENPVVCQKEEPAEVIPEANTSSSNVDSTRTKVLEYDTTTCVEQISLRTAEVTRDDVSLCGNISANSEHMQGKEFAEVSGQRNAVASCDVVTMSCKETSTDLNLFASGSEVDCLDEEDHSAAKHMVDSDEIKYLESDKVPRVTEESLTLRETHEEKTSGHFNSRSYEMSQCFSVSDKTTGEQSRYDAKFGDTDTATPVHTQPRKSTEEPHDGTAMSSSDVMTNRSEHDMLRDTILSADKLESQIKDTDSSNQMKNLLEELLDMHVQEFPSAQFTSSVMQQERVHRCGIPHDNTIETSTGQLQTTTRKNFKFENKSAEVYGAVSTRTECAEVATGCLNDGENISPMSSSRVVSYEVVPELALQMSSPSAVSKDKEDSDDCKMITGCLTAEMNNAKLSDTSACDPDLAENSGSSKRYCEEYLQDNTTPAVFKDFPDKEDTCVMSKDENDSFDHTGAAAAAYEIPSETSSQQICPEHKLSDSLQNDTAQYLSDSMEKDVNSCTQTIEGDLVKSTSSQVDCSFDYDIAVKQPQEVNISPAKASIAAKEIVLAFNDNMEKLFLCHESNVTRETAEEIALTTVENVKSEAFACDDSIRSDECKDMHFENTSRVTEENALSVVNFEEINLLCQERNVASEWLTEPRRSMNFEQSTTENTKGDITPISRDSKHQGSMESSEMPNSGDAVSSCEVIGMTDGVSEKIPIGEMSAPADELDVQLNDSEGSGVQNNFLVEKMIINFPAADSSPTVSQAKATLMLDDQQGRLINQAGGNTVDCDADEQHAMTPASESCCEMLIDASRQDVDDRPETVRGRYQVKFSSAMSMQGNCVEDLAEPKQYLGLSVAESHSLIENEKQDDEIERSLEEAPVVDDEPDEGTIFTDGVVSYHDTAEQCLNFIKNGTISKLGVEVDGEVAGHAVIEEQTTCAKEADGCSGKAQDEVCTAGDVSRAPDVEIDFVHGKSIVEALVEMNSGNCGVELQNYNEKQIDDCANTVREDAFDGADFHPPSKETEDLKSLTSGIGEMSDMDIASDHEKSFNSGVNMQLNEDQANDNIEQSSPGANTNEIGGVAAIDRIDAGNFNVTDASDNFANKSVIKRRNRDVLIHGTPKKPCLPMHDMKENTPAQKRLQRVNATAMKPVPKRKALEKIWK